MTGRGSTVGIGKSRWQAGVFGPEAITEMSKVLDAAFEKLQHIGEPDVARERIATPIIAAVRFGERDPAGLLEAALRRPSRGARTQTGLAAAHGRLWAFSGHPVSSSDMRNAALAAGRFDLRRGRRAGHLRGRHWRDLRPSRSRSTAGAVDVSSKSAVAMITATNSPPGGHRFNPCRVSNNSDFVSSGMGVTAPDPATTPHG
jgi:hypothetical protein